MDSTRFSYKSVFAKQYQTMINQVKTDLVYLGFDFSKVGSNYFKEVMIKILQEPDLIHSFNTNVFCIIAKKHNHTVCSVERTIRTSIIYAYKFGIIKEINCFSHGRAPTIKQLLNYLFDYFVGFDYAY